VGRPSARFFGGNSSGTYIRFPGTNETWLVSSVTNVQTRLVPWLDREIVKVPANTVARISIGAGEGSYELSRPDADGPFVVTGAPEGRELDQAQVRAVTRALADVELEDVKLRSDFALPEGAQEAEVVTFDGLAVRLRVAREDRKNWAVFEAEYLGQVDDTSDAAKAAREAADKINARVGDWIYWVPSNVFTNFTLPVGDLLVPEPDAS